MLRGRYAPLNVFEFVPALSATVDPVLTKLDHLLDEAKLFGLVKADLQQRYPQTEHNGRPSTPVEVIVRMLVVKHLYGWSYAQTEQWVSDSLVLRQFCRVYFEKVPDDTTLVRWANLIKPQTLHDLLDEVVRLARKLKVTRGRKLRMDGTVVETNIHYPTDSSLLADGVRVLSRALHRAQAVVGAGVELSRQVFRDRTRSLKNLVKQIMDATRMGLKKEKAEAEGPTGGREAKKVQMKRAYTKLLDLAEAVVTQAQQVLSVIKEQTTTVAHNLTQTFETYSQRLNQVIEQTRRRVCYAQSVAATEKIVSIFEPHSAIIRKGKLRQPTEFGRAVWLDEVEGGLISRYAILEGNPSEAAQLWPSLSHHKQLFLKPPDLLAADRGVFSQAGEDYATEQGVNHLVLPKPGWHDSNRQAHEQQGWFKRGRNWRAGIEGRISLLKRRQKLARCKNHGEAGMERWVGWGVISHDLWKMAQLLAA
jgi:transposase, IS5 family